MNRNQILFIVLPFFLIFGFQNCQKAPSDSSDSEISPRSSSLSPAQQVIELGRENISSLQFKSRDVVEVNHGGNVISVLKDIIYDFDIKTGELFVTDEEAGSSQRYCLTETLKNELSSLLYSSSVCIYGPKNTQGLTCTQAIQQGYANLITSRDQFRLGYATDGCGSNLIDLCDGDGHLKTWFKDLKLRLASLSCQ